jgi:hypothetical protein
MPVMPTSCESRSTARPNCNFAGGGHAGYRCLRPKTCVPGLALSQLGILPFAHRELRCPVNPRYPNWPP